VTATSTGLTATLQAAVCSDILPGYAFPSAGATITAVSSLAVCPADKFCPGLAAAFATQKLTSNTAVNSYVVSSNAITYASGAYSQSGSALTTLPAGDDTPIPCPTNTGTATVTTKSLLSHCLVTNGYYVATAYAAGTSSPVISQCPAGSTCPTGLTAASSVVASAPLTCTTQTAFICPAGTFTSSSLATAGTVAAGDAGALTNDMSLVTLLVRRTALLRIAWQRLATMAPPS
jgi:hypothetical protein